MSLSRIPEYKETGKSAAVRFVLFAFALCFFVLLSASETTAQWTSTPYFNRQLVLDTHKPEAINLVADNIGGAYIFWSDNHNSSGDKIFFQHINTAGKVSFRADGKRISSRNTLQTEPAAVNNLGNTSVVLFKNSYDSGRMTLVAQRVKENGFLFWTEEGLEFTDGIGTILSFKIASDPDGFTYVFYSERFDTSDTYYRVYLQKISKTGYVELPIGGFAVDSSKKLLKPQSIAVDKNKGVYLLWTKGSKDSTTLLSQYFAADSSALLSDAPFVIKKNVHEIPTAGILPTVNKKAFIFWQQGIADPGIFYTLIQLPDGLTGDPSISKISTDEKCSISTPRALSMKDRSVVLSWLCSYGDTSRLIRIQKFDTGGRPMWQQQGMEVTASERKQSGQQITTDGKNGCIVAWYQEKDTVAGVDIFSQRISAEGELAWGDNGLPIALSEYPNKSFLRIATDFLGGIIAVYREELQSGYGIFGQRILGNKTYTSQIVLFKAEQNDEDVKLHWEIANEVDIKSYQIEYYNETGMGDSVWIPIDTIDARNTQPSTYNIYHTPGSEGTQYYRIIQVDIYNQIQHTQIAKVNFFVNTNDKIFLGQNVPNPFTDSTVIVYSVPSDSESVKFEFYDSRFELVNEIEITDAKTGLNEFTFYAGQLPSGVYFYRFKIADFIDVKKMVITK